MNADKTPMKNPKFKMHNSKPAALRLEAMALEIPAPGEKWPEHPNRVPFSGVLTQVDSASDRAPSGAAGHRVLLPREVAERALPSLLGMAVDYAPGLRGHDVRRKIGVITRAEISGDRLEISGYLYGKDFPDVVRELRARRERLGMSYEVTGVRVKNPAAAVWELEAVVFTGAAILERSAAAYEATSLAAKAEEPPEQLTLLSEGEAMEPSLIEKMETMASEFAALRASMERIAGLLERTASASIRAEVASASVSRKTISPQVMTLLAKSGVSSSALNAGGQLEVPVLDKALEGIPLERRFEVKALLAHAGMLA